MPEKTAEDFVMHSDGKVYFHTGDIGVLHEDGVLQVRCVTSPAPSETTTCWLSPKRNSVLHTSW